MSRPLSKKDSVATYERILKAEKEISDKGKPEEIMSKGSLNV